MSRKPAKLTRLLVVAAAGAALSGCATSMVDESTFFADPATFAMYDCKQLAAARETYAKRIEELQGLMAKAETGAGGSVVAEIAYRPDYLSNAGAAEIGQRGVASANAARAPSQAADPSFARPSPGMDPAAGRSKSRVY